MTGFILHTLRCGAVSKIEIARQTAGSGKMWLRDPQAIVLGRQLVCLGQPSAIFVAVSPLRIVNPQNHGSEERRLGTSEIVGPVGIQDSAVVLHLEQKVVHHVLSKIEPAGWRNCSRAGFS